MLPHRAHNSSNAAAFERELTQNAYVNLTTVCARAAFFPRIDELCALIESEF